jgi:hypothetical protein
MSKEEIFKISLTGGEMTVKDKEITQETAARIIQLLYGGSTASATAIPAGIPVTAVAQYGRNNLDSSGMDAKQFMAIKQPKSDIEKITCLAYYLTKNRGTATFKTVELTHLNQEAAQAKLSNASFTARNAVGQNYLALAGGGKKQITTRGEALVEALPDRSAVQEALEKNPMQGRKKPSAKKAKGGKSKKK